MYQITDYTKRLNLDVKPSMRKNKKLADTLLWQIVRQKRRKYKIIDRQEIRNKIDWRFEIRQIGGGVEISQISQNNVSQKRLFLYLLSTRDL